MMNKFLNIFACCCVTIFILTSCKKEGSGMPDAVGGELPTNFIIITKTAFSPSNIKAVNGSSFTFVNQSGGVVGIYSSDSVVINKQNIADKTSYFFKKDTTGTIIYRLAGNPSISGTITLTP